MNNFVFNKELMQWNQYLSRFALVLNSWAGVRRYSSAKVIHSRAATVSPAGHRVGLRLFELQHIGAGAQLVQVVRPLLDLLEPLFQILRAVVAASVGVLHSVS